MAAGLVLTGYGLITPIKAWMSVHLLNHAWVRVLAGEDDVRPWPWMDSEPVARLIIPEAANIDEGIEKSFVVMRGVSGSILAFAPGWHERTVLPGDPGTTLISAHRDTHFSLLRQVGEKDRFLIENKRGRRSTYEVSELLITENPTLTLSRFDGASRLLLVTCYPLDAWHPSSRQRLVVVANRIPNI